MLSFWEKESFQHYDSIIVGAGITGISAALSLKEFSSRANVLILERGLFPSGASTRNAGFACFGSASEILDDYKHWGKDKAVALIEQRIKGLELLKKRLGEKAIDLHYDGGYELVFDESDSTLSRLEELNSDLAFIFPSGGEKVFRTAPDKLKTFGFGKTHQLIFTPYEGQLHTGKMMKVLIQKAQKLGVTIITGAKVEFFEEYDRKVNVNAGNVSFTCDKLIFCTNGFIKETIADAEVVPARGLVVATHPVRDLPFKGSFHFDKGFYYFRNFNNRIIFGGGRNVDLETEETTDFGINEKILADLQEKLSAVILPKRRYKVDSVWAGVMGFGRNKWPQVERHSDNVFFAAGLSGMGVALGSLIGQKVAGLVTES